MLEEINIPIIGEIIIM